VMATLFIVLPAFWMTSLAFAGIKAGSTLQAMSDGTKGAQQQGGKGKDTIQKVI